MYNFNTEQNNWLKTDEKNEMQINPTCIFSFGNTFLVKSPKTYQVIGIAWKVERSGLIKRYFLDLPEPFLLSSSFYYFLLELNLSQPWTFKSQIHPLIPEKQSFCEVLTCALPNSTFFKELKTTLGWSHMLPHFLLWHRPIHSMVSPLSPRSFPHIFPYSWNLFYSVPLGIHYFFLQNQWFFSFATPTWNTLRTPQCTYLTTYPFHSFPLPDLCWFLLSTLHLPFLAVHLKWRRFMQSCQCFCKLMHGVLFVCLFFPLFSPFFLPSFQHLNPFANYFHKWVGKKFQE